MSCSTIYCDIVDIGNIANGPAKDVTIAGPVSTTSLCFPEVFSEVKATLASTVLKALTSDIKEILQKCSISAKLQIGSHDGNINHILCGNLDDIIIAHEKLKSYLAENIKYFGITEECKENASNSSTYQNRITVNKTDVSSSDCILPQNTISANLPALGEIHSEEDPVIEDASTEKQNDELSCKLARRSKRLRRKYLWKSKIHQNIISSTNSTIIHDRKCDNSNPDLDHDETSSDNFIANDCALEKRKKSYEEATPYKYFCELCSFKTKRSSHFDKHSAIHKKVTSLYKCNKCSFTTIRLGHLRRHETFHSNLVHKCKQCRYQTDNAKFLLRHVRQKHHRYEAKKPAEMWKCKHCPYKTSRQYYFDRHQNAHNANKTSFPLHRCDKCCYSTRRKEHYIRHVNNVHGNQRPYLCHLCGKAFKRGDALRQHHMTHTDSDKQSNANFRCDKCDKVFRSQSHLCEHQAVHSTTRSFLCEICGACFKTRSVQRKHVLSIHKNPRAYSCNVCSKRFNTQYAMKRHQKVHTNQITSEEHCMPNCAQNTLTVVSVVPDVPSLELPSTGDYLTPGFDSSTSDTIGQSILQTPETATALLYLTSSTVQY